MVLADEPIGQISVTGRAEISVPPDAMSLTLGVETEAKEPGSAMAENNARIAKVIAAAKAAGLAAQDIKTSRINLNQRRQQSASTYFASNQIQIDLRDFARAETVIGTLIDAGANQLSSYQPTVDPDPNRAAKLRADAVVDARQIAEGLASAAGVKLGKIVSITTGQSGRPQPMFSARAALAEGAGAVPIEPGNVELAESVSVIFAIDQ